MFFTALYCCFDPLVYHSGTNIQTKFCINMHRIYFMVTNSIVKMGRMFNSCWFFQLYNPGSVAQWHTGTIFSFAAISHASQAASLSSVSYLLQYMSHSTCLNITVSPSELHFFWLKNTIWQFVPSSSSVLPQAVMRPKLPPFFSQQLWPDKTKTNCNAMQKIHLSSKTQIFLKKPLSSLCCLQSCSKLKWEFDETGSMSNVKRESCMQGLFPFREKTLFFKLDSGFQLFSPSFCLLFWELWSILLSSNYFSETKLSFSKSKKMQLREDLIWSLYCMRARSVQLNAFERTFLVEPCNQLSPLIQREKARPWRTVTLQI